MSSFAKNLVFEIYFARARTHMHAHTQEGHHLVQNELKTFPAM
jgi:hypothetical protein